jgi:hypothetical protein
MWNVNFYNYVYLSNYGSTSWNLHLQSLEQKLHGTEYGMEFNEWFKSIGLLHNPQKCKGCGEPMKQQNAKGRQREGGWRCQHRICPCYRTTWVFIRERSSRALNWHQLTRSGILLLFVSLLIFFYFYIKKRWRELLLGARPWQISRYILFSFISQFVLPGTRT